MPTYDEAVIAPSHEHGLRLGGQVEVTCSQEGREAVSRVGGHGAARWRRGGGGLRGHRLGQLWVFNDHPLIALDLGLQLRAKGQPESPHTDPLPGPPAHAPHQSQHQTPCPGWGDAAHGQGPLRSRTVI